MSLDERVQTRNEIIKVVMPHKKYVTSVKGWEGYARQHNLPSFSTIIRYFDSWNNFKDIINVPTSNKKQFDKDELLELAKKHKEFFSSSKAYTEYAKKHNLPSITPYINLFGSWDKLKEELGLPPTTTESKYNRDSIIDIVQEHKEFMDSKKKWNEHAKLHQLPLYETIIRHIAWKELKDILKVKRHDYTIEELIEIGNTHKEYFTTMKIWDKFAKDNQLPLSMTYHRKFGSWSEAKESIFEK